MSQNDLSIANQGFAAFRSDLNGALQALGSTSKGASRPATPYAGQIWLDDDTPSATIWTVNGYDGAQDTTLGLWDTTNDKFIPWAGVAGRVAAKVGAYTLAASERGQLHDVSHATGFTVTLLAAATAANGFGISFRNTGAGVITLDGNASETIDGSTTYKLTPGQSVALACDGSGWHTIASGFRPSVVSVHRNSVVQAAIAISTDTKIQFTTEAVDLQAEFDNATNYRFQPTEPGWYAAVVQTVLNSLASAKFAGAKIFRNGGATSADRWSHIATPGAASGGYSLASALIFLNGSSDYIEFYVFHNDASTRDLNGDPDLTYAMAWRVA